jgi:hypothetical protein
MSKLITYAVCAVVILGAVGGWYAKQQYDAEQRGIAIEKAKVVARANQEIATRRVRDAQFDKMDARQHCLDADLEWVFGDDGKSFCR